MRQLLILFACLAMLLCAGCESGRPICGATLCVDGRVLLKSELADGEYDQVRVDESGLLAFIGDATPAGPDETTPDETISEQLKELTGIPTV